MNEYVIIQFESVELMVSKVYNEILISTYGEDYMTPKRDDFKSFAHELMRQHLGENN